MNSALAMGSRIALALAALAIAACDGKDAKQQTPERRINITVAEVARRDLPVVESAVGTETAVGSPLAYDPTRLGDAATYIRLPFPDDVAMRLRRGQSVKLTSFGRPDEPVEGRIQQIRPPLNTTTHTRDVIVQVAGKPGWRPVGSVRGEVVLDVRKDALVVPEQAVVLRPAGATVYVINDESAHERKVELGVIRAGLIEIRSGVDAGQRIAVDGAALLSEGAKVKVVESRS